MVNQLVLLMAKELKKASKKNEAPIWARLADLAIKPSSARRVVNLTKIDKITKDNDALFVPGKVLGTGNMTHNWNRKYDTQDYIMLIFNLYSCSKKNNPSWRKCIKIH